MYIHWNGQLTNMEVNLLHMKTQKNSLANMEIVNFMQLADSHALVSHLNRYARI